MLGALGHAGHVLAVRLWRRFPWPGGRGRYWCKERIFGPRRGRGPTAIPTAAGWLVLEWAEDLLQKTLYATGRHYETEVTSWLGSQELDGATVLDIGAHVGFYTMMLGRAVGPDGRVVAFEPQPELAAAIEAGLELNRLTWVRVERLAAGDTETELTLHRPEDFGRTTASTLPGEGFSSLQIPMVRLDRWIDEHLEAPPALIKMDIEGGEWLALEGLDRMFESPAPPRLLIEIHPRQIDDLGGSQEALIELLIGHGYSLRRLHHQHGLSELPRPLDRLSSTWHLVAEPRRRG